MGIKSLAMRTILWTMEHTFRPWLMWPWFWNAPIKQWIRATTPHGLHLILNLLSSWMELYNKQVMFTIIHKQICGSMLRTLFREWLPMILRLTLRLWWTYFLHLTQIHFGNYRSSRLNQVSPFFILIITKNGFSTGILKPQWTLFISWAECRQPQWSLMDLTMTRKKISINALKAPTLTISTSNIVLRWPIKLALRPDQQ